jgi:hypothetical protein
MKNDMNMQLMLAQFQKLNDKIDEQSQQLKSQSEKIDLQGHELHQLRHQVVVVENHLEDMENVFDAQIAPLMWHSMGKLIASIPSNKITENKESKKLQVSIMSTNPRPKTK